MGIFRKLGQRLSEHPDHLRAQGIRNQCDRVEGVEQIAVIRPRTKARVVGVVQSIKVIPQVNKRSTLEVQIYDGTDEVTAVWLGRRKIPGIDLGSGLIIEGTIGRFRDDRLKMINPAYELLPIDFGQEH